jgi:hypothetical protein
MNYKNGRFKDIALKLCVKLEEHRLCSTAQLFYQSVGKYSFDEFEDWDKKTNLKTIADVLDELADNIWKEPEAEPELSDNLANRVKILPLPNLAKIEGEENSEIKMLKDNKIIQTIKSNSFEVVGNIAEVVAFYDAIRFLWHSANFTIESIINYSELCNYLRSFLDDPIGIHFLKQIFFAGIFYSPSFQKVSAEEIYRGTRGYLERAEGGIAVTFATSSGIIDPLERYGTAAFANKLELDGEVSKGLPLKDPWREVNFSNGLLNKELPSRAYFFNRQYTAKKMQQVYNNLSSDIKEKYVRLSVGLLEEALLLENINKLRLYEVDSKSFEPPLWRLTRIAPNYLLISCRNKNTKAIAHGLLFNFIKKPGVLESWILNKVFAKRNKYPPYVGIITSAVSGKKSLPENNIKKFSKRVSEKVNNNPRGYVEGLLNESV